MGVVPPSFAGKKRVSCLVRHIRQPHIAPYNAWVDGVDVFVCDALMVHMTISLSQ